MGVGHMTSLRRKAFRTQKLTPFRGSADRQLSRPQTDESFEGKRTASALSNIVQISTSQPENLGKTV